ncbi:MAG: GerMN domain-containing protein, partial [Anaerolineae bacterium]|nr:GerMN domain-containing protein [Anaerolineae bacterium]
TAALNELLAIESREYGQSGLYNALYRSDLTFQDVIIQNRQAIIRLSGRLMLGGVCDEPRVRAQLRETALQYATVDRVSIYVNGRPLDELLTAATPTPTGDDLFTRTNIYLIAVGDDGQSGKEIGCDDSVIPVQVPIEPTIAPLTAALNELLAIESREYGQSGLYNALYQSDLMLEDVTIENREAIVRLSGTLTVGGVCDGPRIEAQLEETALQYATVDRVSIFINGTPLEQLLSQQ